MGIWKIVSGVLSIVLFFFVIFQSCAAGIVNALSQNGDVSGSAGLIVALLLLAGGIVSIATRDAISNGGNIAVIVIYGIAALVGYTMAGVYTDLVIWATWCLLCAVVAAMAIAADNVCGLLVYAVIAVVGVAIAAAGFGMNLGEKDGESKSDNGSGQSVQSNNEEPTEGLPVIDLDEGNETTDNIVTTGSGDLGDYHVEIKNAFLAEDYKGNPAIIVTYAWTNNSEDTTSAMVAVHEKAFQDGVQLDTAVIMGADGYESGTSMTEVRPGTTIDVQCAFALTSETSTVEFEISELISFSDDMVAMDFDPANL